MHLNSLVDHEINLTEHSYHLQICKQTRINETALGILRE